MQRSLLIYLRKCKEKDKRGRKMRWGKSNLIVSSLHMVLWLLGSPLLATGRLDPFTLQTNDKLPCPPFSHFSISPHPPSKHPQNTLNLVRGIMEEANNEGELGVGGCWKKKKEGDVKWPAENIIKQDWNSKGLTMKRLFIFYGMLLARQDKGIPQYSKKGRKRSAAFERFRPQIQTLPP